MEGELVFIPVVINDITVRSGIRRWIKSGWYEHADVSFGKAVDLLRSGFAFPSLEK